MLNVNREWNCSLHTHTHESYYDSLVNESVPFFAVSLSLSIIITGLKDSNDLFVCLFSIQSFFFYSNDCDKKNRRKKIFTGDDDGDYNDDNNNDDI